MGRGEGEDPFDLLIKACQITSSQELKLQNCPFALESDNFPDAVDSLPSQFSPTPTPSEPPTGIIMVSPPETDSDEDEDADEASIDKSTPHENEEFQTPPEHHDPSSQEDPQRLHKPSPAVDVEIEGSDDLETVAIDDGCGKNEVNFDVGERGENLGFVHTEELEGGAVGNGGFESKFKKFRVFEGELDEPSSKKIRVSQENRNSETQTECVGETEITEKGGGGDDDDEEEELICLDVDEVDEGMGEDEDKIVINVDSAEDESEVNVGIGENGKMHKNGEGVSDSESDSEREIENVYCGRSGGVGNPGEEEGGDLDGGENSVMINGGLAVEGYEEGLRENGNDEVFGCGKMEESEKFKCKGSGGVDNPGKGKGVGLDGGERNLLINGDWVVEASEGECRNDVNDEVRGNRKKASGYRGMEEIDKFRYNGDEHRNKIVGRRRELPLSMRGKDDNTRGKERIGSVDVKNLSWKELLDAVAVVLGKMNDGNEDADFLEAAKRKGMTFPKPRWF